MMKDQQPLLRNCEICKKRFFLTCPEEYVYKRNECHGRKSHRVWFCSYTCMRTWDRKHAEDLKKRRRSRKKHAELG